MARRELKIAERHSRRVALAAFTSVLATLALAVGTAEGAATRSGPSGEPSGSLAEAEPAQKSGPSVEGAKPVETSRERKLAARIRLYLAHHDIYKPWYGAVGEISVGRSEVASVRTSLSGARSRTTSRTICSAVLRSGAVGHARVRYESTAWVDC